VKQKSLDHLKIALVAGWMALTIALAAWWLIYGLRQLEAPAGSVVEVTQRHRMLLWEGGVLLLLLVGGGVALLSYVWREHLRQRQVEEFFTAFTHDAKTSLASLRLQAESLREDLGDAHNPLLERLLKDALRLQLQLENSLFLVHLRQGLLLPEPVRCDELVNSLNHRWPDLDIAQRGAATVWADTRALESILTNIAQNAVIHGQAQRLEVAVMPQRETVTIRVSDDGAGFAGDFKQLGKLFARPTKRSGSGVGLYISCQLARHLGGNLTFAPNPMGGFVAYLTLRAATESGRQSANRRPKKNIGNSKFAALE
jgi:signal transduction histidine kinase